MRKNEMNKEYPPLSEIAWKLFILGIPAWIMIAYAIGWMLGMLA